MMGRTPRGSTRHHGCVPDERGEDIDPGHLARWQEVGLYDPLVHTDGRRLELITYLVALGCDEDEMVEAQREGRLFALGGDRITRPGRNRLHLDEVADGMGVPRAMMRAVWDALAMRGDPDRGPVVSTAEAATLAVLPLARLLTDDDSILALCRSIARAAALAAEAGSSVGRRDGQTTLALTGDELTTAQAYTEMAMAIPSLGQMLDMAFRHAVETARVQFEMSASEDLVADGMARLGVAFVDLSGFTAAAATMTPAELAALTSAFEQSAERVAREHHARVVKFIGDAALVAAPTPQLAFEVAAALVLRWRAGEVVPGMTVRAGLAAGPVSSREGDIFGTPVNLAARLVAIAPVAPLVVPSELELAIGGGWLRSAPEAVGLRGFAQPVDVVTLTPVA